MDIIVGLAGSKGEWKKSLVHTVTTSCNCTSVKRGALLDYITKLVVVWSVCRTCTSATKSNLAVATSYSCSTLHLLLHVLQEVGKTAVVHDMCLIKAHKAHGLSE